MATLNLNYQTLADMAKLKAPDGSVLEIAEILEKSTPFIEDMNFIEGNLTTGYKCALRTELPSSTFVKYYQGVTPNKGKRQTLTFTAARQRQIAEMDADLLRLDNNKQLAMMDEAVAHLMGMGQDAEEQFIYGTKDEPEKIVGLTSTYDHLSTDETDIGFNVIDAGGTSADVQTSMWFIYWGKGNIHGFYPKGSTAGISRKIYEEDLIPAPDSGSYEAIRMMFKFDYGLAIPDWRAAVRIANIEVAELADAGESTFDGADLVKLLIVAMNKFKSQVKSMGRPYIYCNRDVKTALDILALRGATGSGGDTQGSNYMGLNSIKSALGEPVTTFQGVPIRLAEKIISTEAVVS